MSQLRTSTGASYAPHATPAAQHRCCGLACLRPNRAGLITRIKVAIHSHARQQQPHSRLHVRLSAQDASLPTVQAAAATARPAPQPASQLVQTSNESGEAAAAALAVDRISTEAGSRRAFCQTFCRLMGLRLASLDEARLSGCLAEQSVFPVHTAPLSDLVVQQKRPYWFNRSWTETDVGYLSFFGAMHAVALVAGPLTFTPEALQVAAAGYLITGLLGLSMSYHRQLSHQSFRCPKWLEWGLAYCGVLAFEGDPVEWAKNHRWHHLHSDAPADRHTPRDGLWHAHMGWLFDEALAGTRRDARGNMKDSLQPPWFYRESPEFYGWIRKTYMYHQLGQAVLLAAWGGAPFLVWGFVIRVLFTMHMTWLVNSAVHIWGTKAYATADESRNNWLVALAVFGDGWHNNHHAFEFSAAHGLEWWQFDASYTLIRALELVGLAWDVKRPTTEQRARLALPRTP